MIAEAIVLGFLSALGWWGANYYVITPYLPEPIYAEKRVEQKKEVTNETPISKQAQE